MQAFKIRFFPLLIVLVLLSSPDFLRAAAPTAIQYQGRLADAGGSPVPNGNYSVLFTIYDAAAGGTSKWSETRSVATVNGLFAVLLGTLSPLADTVFNSPNRYLGVKVGGDPELSPRTQLVSVPYAARVSSVEGATGGDITGNLDLGNSGASSGNLLKGDSLFLHNYGTNNTFLGKSAGNLSITGSDNTASGSQALRQNTSGAYNTASGAGALTSNTSGGNNTAAGAIALYSNTTGYQNTAYGVAALFSNTTGWHNVASGLGALFSNTTGIENTATGVNALRQNSDGDHNTASGHSALYSNTSGYDNTAVGASALSDNTVGYHNTATGYQALANLIDGYGNTANGYLALASNTDANNNTAVGAYALATSTTGGHNTAVGEGALYNLTTGIMNTAIGRHSLTSLTTGSYNTFVGDQTSAYSDTITNSTAIGWGAGVGVSNKVRLGNNFVTRIEGQVPFTWVSDRNQKENFQPVDGDDVLAKIRAMNLTSWNYQGHDPARFRHYGPMAQDFFAAFGQDEVGQIGDSVTINSGDQAGILMIAVQALERRTAEIAGVREENASLRAELEELKVAVTRLLAQSSGTGGSKHRSGYGSR